MPILTEQQEREIALRPVQIQAQIVADYKREREQQALEGKLVAQIPAIDRRAVDLRAEELHLNKEIHDLKAYKASWAKRFNILSNSMPLEVTAEEILTKANEELHDVDLGIKLYTLESMLQSCVSEQSSLREQKKTLQTQAAAARNITRIAKERAAELSKELMASLPLEMQLLKILYVLGEYDRINTCMVAYQGLLNSYSGKIPNKVYAEFIQAISVVVTTVNRKHAEAEMERSIDLKTFPGADALIAQLEYVQRMRAFLSFVAVDVNDPLYKEFHALTEKLDANIIKATLRNRAINNTAQDLAKITLELDSDDSKLMRHLFLEKVEQRMWRVAPVVPLAGLWFGGAIATYVLGASAVESAAMLSSKQSIEAKLLAKKLDPIDFLFINQVDKLMGVHTGVPAEERNITGDTVEAIAKNNAVDLLEKTVDYLVFDSERSHISERIVKRFHKKVQPKIDSTMNLIIALFTITTISAVSSLIILTAVFPAVWPVALAILGTSALLGFGASKLLAPDSTIPQNLIRMSTAITYGLAVTFDYLLSPIRSLNANVKSGRVLASIGSFIGSVLGVTASLVMVPVAVVPVFAATILGFVGAIAPITDRQGVVRRRTFKEIIDTIFSDPLHILQRLNDTAIKANRQILNLTNEERQHIESIVPQVGSMKFIELFEAYLSVRIDAIQKQLQEIGTNYNPELSIQLANDMVRLESDCYVAQALLVTAHAVQDAPEIKSKIIGQLVRHFDSFLQQEFAVERKKYLETCAARKQAPAIQPQDAVKAKPGIMRFSSQDARVKEAEKILGTPPQFEMEYAVDYEKEHMQIERIAGMQQMVSKLRAS